MKIKKLIAIGIIFLFIGVAVAPSINIQIVKASAEDKLEKVTTEISSISTLQIKTKLLTTYNDFVEKLKTENVSIKHMLLLAYVVLINNIEIRRLFISAVIAVNLLSKEPSGKPIVDSLYLILIFYLIFKTIRILYTLVLRTVFWELISRKLGWNWDESPYFPPF
jgi:hypothetical protein